MKKVSKKITPRRKKKKSSLFSKSDFEKCQRAIVIGPGHWGRALGCVLTQVFQELVFLGEEATDEDWDLSFENANPFVVIASPFSSMESILKKLKDRKAVGIANASKGIDRKTLLTFSSLAKKFLKVPYGTLSGPTFAKEVAEGRPSACVFASRDFSFAKAVSERLSHSRFRVYSSDDPIGVEACGAIKNVLAIASGISDGLKLGYNSRAALLTRGLKELAQVVKILGGKTETAFGLAGMGDLWLTATGDLSRNRQLGLFLADGVPIAEALKKLNGPSEGYYTVGQIFKLAKKNRVDLPICEQVYKICSQGLNPREAIASLMSREAKSENIKI